MNNQDYLKHLQLQGLNNSQQQIINHNKFQQQLPEFEFNGQTITPVQNNSEGVHEIRIPIQLPKPDVQHQPKEDIDKVQKLEQENQDNINKINTLQQQIQTLEQQLEQKQSQIDVLEKETKEQINLEHKEEQLVQDKEQENEKINEELERLKKEKIDLQKQFDEKEQQLLNEIENLKKQNEEEMTKINQVQNELTKETDLNEQIENEQKEKQKENLQIIEENQNFTQEIDSLTKQIEELQQQIQKQEQMQEQLNKETLEQNKQELQEQYQQRINRLQDIQKKQIENISEVLDAFNTLSPSDNQNVQRTRQFIEKINDYIKDSQNQIDQHKQQLSQFQGEFEINNQDLETPIENIVDHDKIQNLIDEIKNSHLDESDVKEGQNDEVIDNEQLNNLDHVIDELKTQLNTIDDKRRERKLSLVQSRQYTPQPRKIIQNFRTSHLNRKLPLQKQKKKLQSQHPKRVLVRLVKKIYNKNHKLIRKIPIKRYYKNYI